MILPIFYLTFQSKLGTIWVLCDKYTNTIFLNYIFITVNIIYKIYCVVYLLCCLPQLDQKESGGIGITCAVNADTWGYLGNVWEKEEGFIQSFLFFSVFQIYKMREMRLFSF